MAQVLFSQSISETPSVPLDGSVSDDRIHLDAIADVVRIFVSTVYSNGRLLPLLDIPQAEAMISICVSFPCLSIKDAVIESLRLNTARKEPWQVFGLASRIQHIELAKAAITHFDRGGDSPAGRSGQLEQGDLDGIHIPFYI